MDRSVPRFWGASGSRSGSQLSRTLPVPGDRRRTVRTARNLRTCALGCTDTEEVTGSNPVSPTSNTPGHAPHGALSADCRRLCVRTPAYQSAPGRARPWRPPRGSRPAATPCDRDALGHTCVGMAHQVRNVLDGQPRARQQGHEAVPQFSGGPCVRIESRLRRDPAKRTPHFGRVQRTAQAGAGHQIETGPPLPRCHPGLQLGHANGRAGPLSTPTTDRHKTEQACATP